MNRKTIFILILAVSIIALAACASPASTTNTDTPVPPATVNAIPADTNVPETADSSQVDPTGAPSIAEATPASMDPSLACSAGKTAATVTPELTEGPYYTSGSPEDASLYEEGMAGTKLTVTGYVYDTNCQPVANAWLDFWQADANGKYDNSGYTLRGHQFTDTNGYYTLTTVVPGLYPGRTEHIHFKVQSPNGRVITSQLFFPGVAQNNEDGIFNESLVLPIQQTADGMNAQFNFVVPVQ
jgi:protocatechuate 3,4-dioxygenase beta subunit